MSITKFFALAAVAATTTCALAEGAEDTDKFIWFPKAGLAYADQSAVEKAEWYALCWSKDGVFEGIKGDYTPIDANDRVMAVERFPAGPMGFFTVYASWKITKGEYCIVLLDTRDADGNPAAKDENGKPVRASTQAIAISTTVVTAGLSSGGGTAKGSVANADWGLTDPNPAVPASIAGVDATGDDVKIYLENLLPGVRYNFKAGVLPNALNNYALDVPVAEKVATSAIIPLPKDYKFFRLVQEPMTKPAAK